MIYQYVRSTAWTAIVITEIKSNTLKQAMVSIILTKNVVGVSIGNVILLNLWNALAPFTFAAS